ncbi:MAG: peptide chain release factor N(5)-glutamine methyltransferase [Pseudonocardia sp.]
MREGAAALATAGVVSARHDAEVLAAHVAGVDRGRLVLSPPLDTAAYRRLIARRAAREPLQHLLGTAVLGAVEVAVGPGVFVPRPETELLIAWGLAAVAEVREPLVVDLCTGSGAIALAVATARPDALVHAVEIDPDALVWARRNTVGRAVVLHAADVRDPALLADLAGRVDLVLCNPPYVPDGTPVPPEVHRDPPGAVFGGPDGLDVVRAVVAAAGRLLRPGGRVGIEHDDTHGAAVPALLRARGFTGVAAHRDLAGRPRFATGARLCGRDTARL